ncbi:MAG TPA: C13 family peptidase [Vicinamibacterales bacterium]|nr:C13 family peptidase [Vicinamibacterales bacterium]
MSRWSGFRLWVSCFVGVSSLLSVAAPALAQQTRILVIVGSPGDDEHARKFADWSKTFVDAAKKKDAVPDADITQLSGPQAAKANVEKAFADVAAKAKPNDELVVLLIGHGAFDGAVATFNIPGPDLTAADYAKLLSKFPSQKIVFVNTATSSGAFLQPLAGPNRVIITSTKTGGERNEPEFGQFFVAAFDDDAADRDRNGHVSIAEAFEYASTKVKQDYQQKSLILTEHATLQDGDDGRLAAAFFLGTGRGNTALNADLSDPDTKKLVEEKDALEKEIAGLQLRRTSMAEAEYSAQMEKLLTDLALKTKAIRDRAAKK